MTPWAGSRVGAGAVAAADGSGAGQKKHPHFGGVTWLGSGCNYLTVGIETQNVISFINHSNTNCHGHVSNYTKEIPLNQALVSSQAAVFLLCRDVRFNYY